MGEYWVNKMSGPCPGVNSKSTHKVTRQFTEPIKFRSKSQAAKSAGKLWERVTSDLILKGSHDIFLPITMFRSVKQMQMWITLEVQVQTQQRCKRFYFLFFSTVTRSFQGVDLNIPRDYSERLGSWSSCGLGTAVKLLHRHIEGGNTFVCSMTKRKLAS